MWSRCHWLCRSRRSVLHCEIWRSLSDCSPMHRHRQEISNRHDTWRVKRTRAWEGRRCHHDESAETSELSINHNSESGLERKLERNCLVRRTRSAKWSSCDRGVSEVYVTSQVKTLGRVDKVMNFIQTDVSWNVVSVSCSWFGLSWKLKLLFTFSFWLASHRKFFRSFVRWVLSTRCWMCFWREKDNHENVHDLVVDLRFEMTRAPGESLLCLHPLYVARFRALLLVLSDASFIFIIKLFLKFFNSVNQEFCCAIRYFN